MFIEVLSGVDFAATEQPEMNADLREYVEGWYRYQRHEFIRKLRDLTPERIVALIDEYALHPGQAHMLRFAALGEMLR